MFRAQGAREGFEPFGGSRQGAPLREAVFFGTTPTWVGFGRVLVPGNIQQISVKDTLESTIQRVPLDPMGNQRRAFAKGIHHITICFFIRESVIPASSPSNEVSLDQLPNSHNQLVMATTKLVIVPVLFAKHCTSEILQSKHCS